MQQGRGGMESRPMKPAEVAARWRVSIPTIHRMIERGELRAIRLGRLVRIAVAEVDRVEQGECHSHGSSATAGDITPSGEKAGKPTEPRSGLTIVPKPNGN